MAPTRCSGRCFWAGVIAAHLLFLREGLWINDEGAYLLMSRSIVENFPGFLDLSPYLTTPQQGPYYSFFWLGGEVHAGISPGLPLLSAPLYLLAGGLGIKLTSTLASIGTAWVLYRLVSRMYGEAHGRFAALLYVFATPAVFYATSMWYHSLATFFLTLCIYALDVETLRYRRLLIPLSGALSVLCAFYLLPPALVLVAGGALRMGRRGAGVLMAFLLLLTPSFAYNLANFGKLTGEHSVPAPVVSAPENPGGVVHLGKRVLESLPSLLLVSDLRDTPWSRYQKAVFQSSPVLALGLLSLLRAAWLRVPLLSMLTLLLEAAYAGGDFGGWSLSMRYLTPAFPVLCAGVAAYLHERKLNPPAPLSALLAMSVLLLLYPLDVDSTAYLYTKAAAAVLALAGVAAGAVRLRSTHLRLVLISLLLFSAFVNLNDAAYGASYRSMHAVIDGALAGAYETIYFPAGGPFGGLFLPGKSRVAYTPGEPLKLEGRVTLVGTPQDVPPGCRVESLREFGGVHRYLVRDGLRSLLREVEGMRVMNLVCKGL